MNEAAGEIAHAGDASRFLADGYARELVPESQRGSGRRVFFIVAGALCGLPVYVLSAQVVNGMGFARARWAFLLGGVLSGTLGALSAYSGAVTRMNLAMLAEHAFGVAGGRLVKLVIASSLIGWLGVILSVLGATVGSTLESLYGWHIDSRWIAVMAGIAVAVITLRGVKGLEHIGMVIAPLLCVLLAWTFYKGCAPGVAGAAGAAAGAAGTGALSFGAAVSAVVGEYVVGIVIQPDYGRFVRRPLGAAGATGSALGVAFPAILIISAIPASLCSAPDLISVMVSIGIGLPALALLVLGAWTDAAACLYSGSLSLTNEVKRFRLTWVTLVSAGIGCVLAVLHAERQFMPFLALLGIAFPPVAAVNILHVVCFLRGGAPLRSPPSMRWGAIGAWVAGSVTGYLSGNGIVTLSGVASIDSIVAAALVWSLVYAALPSARPPRVAAAE